MPVLWEKLASRTIYYACFHKLDILELLSIISYEYEIVLIYRSGPNIGI